MTKKDQFLALIEGRTDAEIIQILQDDYGINWDPHSRACKLWYAKVFTYCNTDHLEDELNFFLWLVNHFSRLFHVCFQVEETVFLGCICPCGNKQTVLYYSISRN